MKPAQKSRKTGRPVPLVWRDCSWDMPVIIQPAFSRETFGGHSRRRGMMPFSPFRGFHFSQLAVQKI